MDFERGVAWGYVAEAALEVLNLDETLTSPNRPVLRDEMHDAARRAEKLLSMGQLNQPTKKVLILNQLRVVAALIDAKPTPEALQEARATYDRAVALAETLALDEDVRHELTALGGYLRNAEAGRLPLDNG